MTHVTDTLQSTILLENIITREQRKRFYARIDSSGEACWLWSAGKDGGGYGSLSIGSKKLYRTIPAHRLAWALAHPTVDIGPKDYVCHTCDNPSCCRPNHLYLGTAMTNMRDTVARDRHRQHKLSWKKQPDDDLDALFGPS